MLELMEDPEFAAGRQAANQITHDLLDAWEYDVNRSSTDEVHVIPVVFHILHKGETVGSGTNISTAQVLSAVEALNRDFSAASADGGVAQSTNPVASGNTNIQFCLASVDPSGSPTTGIIRINGSSVSGYSTQGITDANELAVKSLSRWDNRYYLNIWVVSEIENNNADVSNPNNFTGGILGYAYYPVSPVTLNSNLDGIVAINLSVGNDPGGAQGYRLWPFTRLNRTLTHEVGHYLNLAHTFEGESCSETNCNNQGDFVCDTPPTVLNPDCDSPACSGTQQVENYMDYSGDACYNMFSTGQKNRMRAAIEGVRSQLVNTNNCASPVDYDAAITIINSGGANQCVDGPIIPIIQLSNFGGIALASASVSYRLNGGTEQIYNWTGNLGSGTSVNIDLPAFEPIVGNNSFEVEILPNTLNNGQTDENTSNNTDVWTFDAQDGTEVQITIELDDYGSETTWQLRNASNTVLLSGGPYVDGVNSTIQETICLSDGCYQFIIFDDFGDGICCEYGNGSYILSNLGSGTVLGSGGSFFDEETVAFCITTSDPSLCIASSEECDEHIVLVSIADVEYPSACNNYSSNTNLNTLVAGESYDLLIETATPGGLIGYIDDQVAAWIDWNGDDDFDDSGELILSVTYSSGSVAFPSATFTVPANPSPNAITMRVRMSYLPDDGPISPCGTTIWGEVEDYTIQVIQATGVLSLNNTPLDFEISCESDDSPASLGSVTASSTCNVGVVEVSYSDQIIPGSCDNEWTIIRNWNAIDGCGNSLVHQQEIAVIDQTEPSIICNLAYLDLTTETNQAAVPDFSNQVDLSDNCPGNLSLSQTPEAGEMRPIGSHNVVLLVQDACGNTNECAIEVNISSVIGLEEILGGEILVYPNPTEDFVMLQFPKPLLSAVIIEVYSVTGKLIMAEKIQDIALHQLDLSNTSKGIYLLQIRSDAGTAVKKITVL